MHIAFLLLVHQKPEQFARLVRRLAHPDASIFVHVDRKADAAPFRRAAEGLDVTFLPDRERRSVQWAGFSMIEATLALIRRAFAAGADRFTLLSGIDYPVLPPAALHAALAEDVERIQVDTRLDPRNTDWFTRCGYGRFLGDIPIANPRTGSRFVSKLAGLVARCLPDNHHPLPVHYGSQWWTLTRDAIAWILDQIDTRPEVLAGFRQARVPDEMVFQTLVKASPRSGHIAYDAFDTPFRAKPHRAAAHFIRWEHYTPTTLTMADLDDILASEALFMRKVDPTQSAALLDRLDQRA